MKKKATPQKLAVRVETLRALSGLNLQWVRGGSVGDSSKEQGCPRTLVVPAPSADCPAG